MPDLTRNMIILRIFQWNYVEMKKTNVFIFDKPKKSECLICNCIDNRKTYIKCILQTNPFLKFFFEIFAIEKAMICSAWKNEQLEFLTKLDNQLRN